jgi:prepilin-type N-terminal cleavage/methylation domain-containing protein
MALQSAPHRGFTFAEIAISILLIGILTVAALNTVGASLRRQTFTANQVRGKQLASDLMQEILQQAYQDPLVTPVFGPEPGETTGTRSKFNDVDDYLGWKESPPADKSGVAYVGFTGWTRSVNVQWADPVTLASTAASNTGLKLITVTVAWQGQTQATLVGYRSVAWADTIPSPTDATANHPPAASFGGSNFSGKSPLTANFDATGSSDPDGNSLSYVWQFGDGTDGQGSTITHTYSTAGTYTATLTVYDGKGGVGSASQVITATH